ncbi:TetR family transcriptional regulator [Leptospira perolatii]|uniref:TetR family transcriptional regulator n=1 Tax=Leptospira perolatii TaxID=2023191 RepID=A0A2M9ZRE5_9LEPT|nr:TetR/AcrR family transcriptional regulator [Leptospira perolatii]PJZ70971.1 TetR family transcriptional regulator [Leptospira perolatii]PJZ74503.1 TetR family transcriptional regulator [Leptospira perolatii]
MAVKKKGKKVQGSYHHGSLAETLKSLALKRLGESKDSDFTIREIARKAQVSHAAAYRHFPSRRDLLAELSKDGFIAITKSFEEAERSANPDDAIDQLKKIGVAYVTFCVRNPGYYRAMWHTDLGPKDDLPDLMEAGKNSFLKLWDTVLKCKEEGRTDLEAQDLSAACWSLVHGLSVLLNENLLSNPLIQFDKSNAEQIAERIISIHMHGIAKR